MSSIEPSAKIMLGDIVTVAGSNQKYIVTHMDETECQITEYPQRQSNPPITMSMDRLSTISGNVRNAMRVKCNIDNPLLPANIDAFVYLLIDKQRRYKMLRNAFLSGYIYTFDQIPLYIKFFIFLNCYQFQSMEIQSRFFSRITSFKIQFENFINAYKTLINLSPTQSASLERTRNREQKQKLDEKKAKLQREYDELDSKLTQLENTNKQYKKITEQYSKLLEKYEGVDREDITSSDQEKMDELGEQIGVIEQPFISKMAMLEKQIKIMDNLMSTVDDSGIVYTGGSTNLIRPREKFEYLPQQSGYLYPPESGRRRQGNYPYYDNYRFPSGPIPPNNMYPPYAPYAPYPPQRPNPNFMNKFSSKLSFYVEIDLELFPGKSANMLQKSVVRCQSTFERIREAYADIFGYEYRPGTMNMADRYNKPAEETQMKPPNILPRSRVNRVSPKKPKSVSRYYKTNKTYKPYKRLYSQNKSQRKYRRHR